MKQKTHDLMLQKASFAHVSFKTLCVWVKWACVLPSNHDPVYHGALRACTHGPGHHGGLHPVSFVDAILDQTSNTHCVMSLSQDGVGGVTRAKLRGRWVTSQAGRRRVSLTCNWRDFQNKRASLVERTFRCTNYWPKIRIIVVVIIIIVTS